MMSEERKASRAVPWTGRGNECNVGELDRAHIETVKKLELIYPLIVTRQDDILECLCQDQSGHLHSDMLRHVIKTIIGVRNSEMRMPMLFDNAHHPEDSRHGRLPCLLRR